MTRDIAALDEIARSITSSLELDVVLPRIADAARRLCNSDTASIFLRDAEAAVMVPRFRVGNFPAAYAGLHVAAGRGIGGQAWRAGHPVRTANYDTDPGVPDDFRHVARQAQTVAVMAVPIIVAAEVEGLLYVGNHTARPFTDAEETTCVWLAHQAAIAVQNASLFSRERRMRAEAERVATLASHLAASLDVDRVLQAVAEAVRDIVEADVVRLALRDEADGTMRYRHLVGTRAAGYDRLILDHRGGFVGRVLATGRPYRAARALDDPAVHPEYGRHFIEAEGVRTAMVVPVRSEGRITGVIYCARRRERPFSDEDERIVLRLAEYAAVALRNAESFRREHTARAEAEAMERRASFLAQASILLSASLDVEATLRSVVRLAVPFLADFCAVDIADERGQPQRIAAVHTNPAKEPLVRDVRQRYGFNPKAHDGVPSVIATGRSAFVPHVTEDHLRAAATSDEHLALLSELEIGSWIIVPLVARGRVLGAITFVMAESGRRYTPADVGMAEDLGRRAAVALENAQLYREAQRANQAKDEFLAMVSHELRTPINAVYGWARMVRADRMDAETKGRGLEVIERNARAQVQLIDDLLDVSRIVTGKLRLDVRPVDVAAAIDGTLDAVRPAADAKGVRLHVVIDPRATPIMGDPDRLQQVVWNLAMNSIKYTPRGGRIEVTLRRINSHVELVVADTGAGIDAALLPHVFERFRRGDREHGGLGIGLALVRHLIELHGGTVSASSDGLGRGATFTVKLPISVANRAPDVPVVSTPSLDGATLDGVDVVVVDDDPDSLELLRAILTEAGASVRSAASAVEAVDHFDARPPQVVVSDIEMPGENGYALVRRLRQRSRETGGTVPIVALTAYGGLQERIKALEAGFDMHIPKPVDPVELTAVLSRLARRGL